MTNMTPALQALGNAKVHLDAIWHSFKDDESFSYKSLKEIFEDTATMPDCESQIALGSPLLGSQPIFMEVRSKVHNFSLLMVWNCQYFNGDNDYLRFKSIQEYKFTKSIEPGSNL